MLAKLHTILYNILQIKSSEVHKMVYENIRNLRKKYDKLQIELAMYLNVRQTTYSKYELGKIQLPLDILLKLADFYDVSIDYIVGRSTNDSSFKARTENQKKKR